MLDPESIGDMVSSEEKKPVPYHRVTEESFDMPDENDVLIFSTELAGDKFNGFALQSNEKGEVLFTYLNEDGTLKSRGKKSLERGATYTMGGSPSNEIVNFLHVDDKHFSRKHLRIILGDKLIIKDLESSNGTYVEEVSKKHLRSLAFLLDYNFKIDDSSESTKSIAGFLLAKDLISQKMLEDNFSESEENKEDVKSKFAGIFKKGTKVIDRDKENIRAFYKKYGNPLASVVFNDQDFVQDLIKEIKNEFNWESSRS